MPMPKIGDAGELNGVDVFLAQIFPLAEGTRFEVWTSDGKEMTQDWCECGAPGNDFYWERLTVDAAGKVKARIHGWGCGKCRKVSQSG